MFPLPVLDSLEPILHQENRHARVTTYAGAAAADFDVCCLQLLEAGYEQAEACVGRPQNNLSAQRHAQDKRCCVYVLA